MSSDWIPARKISAKERGNRGFIPTKKNPLGFVEYESCIERDLFLVAIHDPNVYIIKHQPVSIMFLDEKGRSRRYTPDASIRFLDGTEILVEMKPDEEVRDNARKYSARWEAAKQWATANKMTFTVITDEEIRTARWINVWFTLGASKCVGNDKYISRLNLLIQPDGDEYNLLCYKFSQVMDVEIGKAAQVLCYAIYHGLVFVDTFTTKQISKNTIIRKRIKDIAVPFKSFWQELKEMREIEVLSSNIGVVEDNTIYIKEVSTEISQGIANDDLIERREKMVLTWLSQPKTKRTSEWRAEFCNEWGMSESNIYRLISTYNSGGRKALYPKHANAGRKKKFDGITLELIEDVRQQYLKPGVTLNQCHKRLDALCKSKGIETPAPASFNWYVYQNTTAVEFAQKKGKKFQKASFTPSLKSFQGGILPMQVIQMDNSPYDVFPVDELEREPLASPSMTAAIDCYTGMITGFLVSYFPSSSRTVLEVLVQSILPKERYTTVYETQHAWPIQGFPVVILVDNGMDYRSKSLKEFCIKYDIIIEFVPLRTPRYKAFIEQWFNVLKNAMKQESIPGLRPTLKQRVENPDLKPEKEAILTLQEIEIWLHKWIVDTNIFTNHYGDHVLAPFLKLSDAQEGRTELVFPATREPPSSPAEIDEIYLSTLKTETRTLTRDGVFWEHLRYNSKELADIHKIRGNEEVTILRDTRDVRRVWVINPIDNKPLFVGLGSGWAAALLGCHGDKPVHESAWRRDVNLVRRKTKERLSPHLYTMHIAEQERLILVDNAKKLHKTARREREKIIEANKKNIDLKLTHKSDDDSKDIFQTEKNDIFNEKRADDDNDIFKTYKPKGLVTSKYPKKAEVVKKP